MKKGCFSKTSRQRDEYPEVTQADFDRARFRVGLKPVPRKQRINIMLDTGVVAFFRARAGGKGYQTLINEALKQAVGRESLAVLVRRVIREELARRKAS